MRNSTTLMIRNLPNKLTPPMIMECVDELGFENESARWWWWWWRSGFFNARKIWQSTSSDIDDSLLKICYGVSYLLGTITSSSLSTRMRQGP